MKKNQFNEFKSYDIKALKEAVKKAKAELADLILDKNMNKLSDLRVVSKKKKDIAQMSTILRQKQLVEELETKLNNIKIRTGQPSNVTEEKEGGRTGLSK